MSQFSSDCAPAEQYKASPGNVRYLLFKTDMTVAQLQEMEYDILLESFEDLSLISPETDSGDWRN